MICSRLSLVPLMRLSAEESVLLIRFLSSNLSFHFVLSINAFLLTECKPHNAESSATPSLKPFIMFLL
jgi:hypothetical protein